MILVDWPYTLSQQMFSYCFARSLAVRFGFELQAPPIAGWPGTYEHVGGDRVLGPTVVWDGQWPFENGVRKISPQELVKRPNARLFIRGSFQRYDLLAPHQHEIRKEWLFKDIHETRPRNEMIISIASGAPLKQKVGSYGGGKNLTNASGSARKLTSEEIARLLDIARPSKCYLVVDDVQASLTTELCSTLNVIPVQNSVGTFDLVRSFNKIAFAENTLHWWAAYLSEAEEIYFPHLKEGQWSHPAPAALAHDPSHHGIDLRVPEPRFIYDW